MLSLLYFVSALTGASALVYAVEWTRQFGDVFGNTVYTSLLATSVMMLAAGAGSFVIGASVDRRLAGPETLPKTLARMEWTMAALGAVLSLLLPHLGFLSGLVSFYSRGANGWYHISWFSSALRMVVAIVLFAPGAFLFGGTLIVAGRFAVGPGARGVSRIAVLAGVMTIGAGLGLAAAEFGIAPRFGTRTAELFAVLLTAAAGFGAALLATRPARSQSVLETATVEPETGADAVHGAESTGSGRGSASGRASRRARTGREAEPAVVPRALPTPGPNALALTTVGVALCGGCATALTLLWVRHFTLLLGGFRLTHSLLFVLVALALGAGSLLGALLVRHTSRPAQWLIAALAIFVVFMFVGLGITDIASVLAPADALAPGLDGAQRSARFLPEVWLNARTILLETGIPALLLGLVFPLASAIVQQMDEGVGARMGTLVGTAAIGAVAGLLITASLLLPRLGIQSAALVVGLVAALAAIPFDLATRGAPGTRRVRSATATLVVSLAVSAFSVALWLLLPADDLIARATVPRSPDERLLSLNEGAGEFVAVTESAAAGRNLVTGDQSMSAFNPLGRRSMRALVHIPLTLVDRPDRVLVIGFRVGHAVHAATLHPSVQRVDVAEPSPQILSDAGYFREVNKDVLSDRRVNVFVNDGRQHLRMQAPASYDVIAIDPTPTNLDRSGTLYSQEFYALARTRLKPGGYFSQWLPTYQVPPAALLGMIRAFVDVFPQAVLLGASDQELLLVGINGSASSRIDPARVSAKLAGPPALAVELQSLNLATVREFVATFVASSQKLAAVTRDVSPSSDDRPAQEFVARSRATAIHLGGLPSELVDLQSVSTWCPDCFIGGSPAPVVAGLAASNSLLQALYTQTLPPESGPGSATDPETQTIIKGNAFLRNVIAQHVARRNARGVALASANRLDEAIVEFRNALRLDTADARTHWNLGRALVSRGQPREAVEELRRAVELNPTDGPAHYDLASTLLDLDQVDGAIDEFRAALVVMPDSVEAHNNLGIALGRKGRLSEAIGEFQQALKLNPQSGEARHNLDAALMAARTTR